MNWMIFEYDYFYSTSKKQHCQRKHDSQRTNNPLILNWIACAVVETEVM